MTVEPPCEVNALDPLADRRWIEFVHRHPHSTVFHTVEWVRALVRTYGYRPLVLTTTPPLQPLENGLLCCEVRSWITGRRLVSLPFSDHCQPLATTGPLLRALLKSAERFARDAGHGFVELRPCNPLLDKDLGGFFVTATYWLHSLRLDPDPSRVLSRLHPSCIQRQIRKADKAGLSCQTESGPEALRRLYQLQIATRRRHGLPPQPRLWFENLVECLGDRLRIHLGLIRGRPVAGVLTLRFKKTLVYKYGCSDARWHSTGVVPWLMWQSALDGIEAGCEEFDLGRTDKSNTGLTLFKDRWDAARKELRYYRSPPPSGGGHADSLLKRSKPIWNRLPDRFLEMAGGLLYRHFG